MSSRPRALTPALLMLAGLVPAVAAETGSDVPLTRDLTAVIALQGLPCGSVVTATEQRANDFLATCSDGSRYRVYVDATGRVVAESK